MTKQYFAFLLIAILSFTLIGFGLTNTLAIAQQELQLSEASCVATDPASFKTCLEKAKNNRSVDLIRINEPIICTNRDECAFEIKDMTGPLLIYGVDRRKNDFIRINDYSYPLFTIENSRDIQFTDVAFNDDKTSNCYTTGGSCKPIIQVLNSSKITFDNLTLLNAKQSAITITDSNDITLKKSRIIDASKFGVQVSSSAPVSNIKIINNNFINSASNAIVFSVKSNPQSPSSISYNIFRNNHSGAAYSNCVYPCLGGQLRIDSNTENVTIEGNRITKDASARSDATGFFASGIEIGSQNVKNVTMACNEITNNSGSGIVQSEPVQGSERISAKENKIYQNGINMNILRVIEENNCFGEVCTLNCSTIRNPST